MPKFKAIECTVAEAVSNGFSELQALAEEIREIVDNAEGGLAQTQRIQTLSDTADTLEQLSEPTIEGNIAEIKVTYLESQPRGKRGLSRRARCENAISALDAVIAALQEKADELPDESDAKEELEGLVNELEDAKGNAEGCEFPGKFG